MAGNPAARGDAADPQNDINDWMRDRKTQLQTQQQADAAGREAWASSTRTGENLQAPQPENVRALSSQAQPDAANDGDASSSPIQAVSDAFNKFQKGPAIPRPTLGESLFPLIGPGWEAVADLQQGHYAGAALNGALAVSDLFLAGSIAKGIAKGGLFVAENAARKKAPYAWSKARKWMQEQRFIKAGEHGHHWAIPQKQWGKVVPDWIKNQPWNIKSMDPITHWRLEHRVGALPRFGPAERIWRGTPAWSKAAAGSVVGRSASAAELESDRPQ